MAAARVGYHWTSPFAPQAVSHRSTHPAGGSNRHPPEDVSYTTTEHFGQATGAINECYRFEQTHLRRGEICRHYDSNIFPNTPRRPKSRATAFQDPPRLLGFNPPRGTRGSRFPSAG